jgi:pimeloyl-ACP methyl ester carboxylesterase
MYVNVNGAKLYVDVEGAGLVPDGPRMREKPTLLMLHGGPGFDHTMYKPAFSRLTDIAQVVYYDHRGQGRSGGEPETWTLAQWGDDVKGLCDALGIEKPIVLGGSFGGFVAQAYATRHPAHPGKLILASTCARVVYDEIFAAFERIGGKEARAAAQAYWLNPTMESRLKYLETCLPFYNTRAAKDPDALKRAILRHDVGLAFNGPKNEQARMDFRESLARVQCPVLVLAGDRDPIMPMSLTETLVSSLPPHLVRFERFENCGHGVHRDDPEKAFRIIREFVSS